MIAGGGVAAVVAVVVVAVAVAAGITLAARGPTPTVSSAAPLASANPSGAPDPFIAPAAAALSALPDANYDAVIPALLDAAAAAGLPIRTETFTLKMDRTPLYADRLGAPVATLPLLNFLGTRTVVAPVILHDGAWTQILTPSRRGLPSASPNGVAAAQTMAWVRTDALVAGPPIPQHVLVNVTRHTMSIVNTSDGAVAAKFPIGVGKASTATPIGITYLQARYVDAKQVVGDRKIYLTAAHSAVADHPFGPDQGLVGIHWAAVHDGAVSHACIRLNGAGDAALSKLAVGTPVLIVE